MGRELISIFIGLMFFAPVIILSAGESEAAPGTFFAYTYYKNYCGGCYAKLLTTDPAVWWYSGVANFVSIEFNGLNWFAIGWCEGVTYWGDTNGAKKFYYDRSVEGVYSGGLLGDVSVNTWHTYRIAYQLGTTYKWTAYIDNVTKASTVFTSRTALIAANVEIHDTMDDVNCHITNLQYAVIVSKIVRWYPWDGYGSKVANPPLVMTIVSNTEWTCIS